MKSELWQKPCEQIKTLFINHLSSTHGYLYSISNSTPYWFLARMAEITSITPWFCLLDSNQPQPKPKTKKKPQTFANAIINVCGIPLSQLSKPFLKGDRLEIMIPNDDDQARLEHANTILKIGSYGQRVPNN